VDFNSAIETSDVNYFLSLNDFNSAIETKKVVFMLWGNSNVLRQRNLASHSHKLSNNSYIKHTKFTNQNLSLIEWIMYLIFSCPFVCLATEKINWTPKLFACIERTVDYYFFWYLGLWFWFSLQLNFPSNQTEARKLTSWRKRKQIRRSLLAAFERKWTPTNIYITLGIDFKFKNPGFG